VVALAGAGGKTTLLGRLRDEAQAAGLRVLITTTTHMGFRSGQGPVFLEAEGDPRAALERALREQGRATLFGRRVRDDKMEGVAPERVDALAPLADLVLVEADGARGRGLKAPADHEPVVPASTTLLLVLASLDLLGRPFGPEAVHRFERVQALTGRGLGEPIDDWVFVAALGHPSSYPRHRPACGRLGAFLNKAEIAGEGAAEGIARRLVPPYDFVAAGSARGGAVRVTT
jgi:probable selenium-dependent hydroxylase accessory protein YqeC